MERRGSVVMYGVAPLAVRHRGDLRTAATPRKSRLSATPPTKTALSQGDRWLKRWTRFHFVGDVRGIDCRSRKARSARRPRISLRSRSSARCLP